MANYVLIYLLIVLLNFLFLAYLSRIKGRPIQYWSLNDWGLNIISCVFLHTDTAICVIKYGVVLCWYYILKERHLSKITSKFK